MQPLRISSPYPSPIQSAGGPLPPVRRPLRRLLVLTVAAVVGVACGVGIYYLWTKLTARHAVLVDNGNDFAVDVEVAGEKISLAPHTTRTVKVKGGRLEVRASGPNGWTESASLDMPEAAGWGAARTALYNINGASVLAIVTMTYGSVPGAPPPINELAKANKLQLLPAGSYGDIDEAFPSSVRSKRHGELVQRVCHLVDGGSRVGCPN